MNGFICTVFIDIEEFFVYHHRRAYQRYKFIPFFFFPFNAPKPPPPRWEYGYPRQFPEHFQGVRA